LRDDNLDYVGGLEMGAVPLNRHAHLSWIKGHPIAAFFVQAEEDAGARLAVEGLAKASLRGKRIVIVEDVTTTGGSALRQSKPCRPAARSRWSSPWSTATGCQRNLLPGGGPGVRSLSTGEF
jgi:orotate phosphoribosyltransferase